MSGKTKSQTSPSLEMFEVNLPVTLGRWSFSEGGSYQSLITLIVLTNS
jgi:hypothetical protein